MNAPTRTLLLCTALIGAAGMAQAQATGLTRADIEAAYAEFERIEIAFGPTQVKVEAVDAQTGQVVDLVVKRRARAAGLHGDYGAHSLRSGLVTTLRKRNVRDRHIKAITGHKTDKMLDHYDKSPLDDAMRAVSDAIAVE